MRMNDKGKFKSAHLNEKIIIINKPNVSMVLARWWFESNWNLRVQRNAQIKKKKKKDEKKKKNKSQRLQRALTLCETKVHIWELFKQVTERTEVNISRTETVISPRFSNQSALLVKRKRYINGSENTSWRGKQMTSACRPWLKNVTYVSSLMRPLERLTTEDCSSRRVMRLVPSLY